MSMEQHWKVPERYHVLLGGNRYIDCGSLVTYKGKSLFNLQRSERDGVLGINFDLYAKDGSRVATIRNSRFVDFEPEGYEVRRSHDHFTLIEKGTGRQVCDLRLRGQATGFAELEVAASMYMPDGRLVVFDHKGTDLGGIQMTNTTFERSRSAIVIA